MEIISAFFSGLWSMLSSIRIPIIDTYATTFIVGLFLVVLIIECINKILSKETLHFGEGK